MNPPSISPRCSATADARQFHIAELKLIYSDLAEDEARCIKEDKMAATQETIPDEQWQTSFALHKTLLGHHHDFLLACQNPASNSTINSLPEKYAIPTRMWRHAIYSFLDLLKQHLPKSREHMSDFINHAYVMSALLYQTVPAFKQSWMETLGDISRFGLVVEYHTQEKEVWAQRARGWYRKATYTAPTTGRLYHSLGCTRTRPSLQQCFEFLKALCIKTPAIVGRKSLLGLFDRKFQVPPFERSFLRVHEQLFVGSEADFDPVVEKFFTLLKSQIEEPVFSKQASLICLANTFALLGYGTKKSALLGTGWSQQSTDSSLQATDLDKARKLANGTLEIALEGDAKVLPLVYVMLAFMLCMSKPSSIDHLSPGFPWKPLVALLNSLSKAHYPKQRKQDEKELPEEYQMRGSLWYEQSLLEVSCCELGDAQADEIDEMDEMDKTEETYEMEGTGAREQTAEDTEIEKYRKERILWVGSQLAKRCNYINYDQMNFCFTQVYNSK